MQLFKSQHVTNFHFKNENLNLEISNFGYYVHIYISLIGNI